MSLIAAAISAGAALVGLAIGLGVYAALDKIWSN